MDLLTHGLLGAAVAQALFTRRIPGRPWAIGMFAALLPDLDVLFALRSDPLTATLLHRHFSHALAFAPVWALAASLPFVFRERYRPYRGWVFSAALAGVMSHVSLDACTFYGTCLWWPVSARRVALDWVALIDPLVTLPLLLGVWYAGRKHLTWPAAAALALSLGYLGFAALQHERAMDAQRRIAESRGHSIARGRVMPTLGQTLRWRSVYEHEGRLYADGLRLGVTPTFFQGRSVRRLKADDLPDDIPGAARLRGEFERFEWFADGYTARSPVNPSLIADMRISLEHGDFRPLWGVRIISEDADTSLAFIHTTSSPMRDVGRLWRDLTGDHGYLKLPEPAVIARHSHSRDQQSSAP